MSEEARPRRILDGMRVIEMTSAVFGPYAGMMLGDLGAEVIRVEPPQGDFSRNLGPGRNPGMSPLFLTLNRNKRSVTLDLAKPQDLAVMKGLIAKADVFLHSVRADGIRRLGLDYEGCRKLRDDIVYVHCVGYGGGGRYAGRMAFDDMVQGAAGLTHLAPMTDGDPTPRYWPVLAADKLGGVHTAYAAVAALLHRERTGEGQAVESPMFEAMTFFNMSEHMFGETMVPATGPLAYPWDVDPERKPYRTKDGWLSMFMFPRAWREFCLWGDRPDLLEDRRMQAYGRGEPIEGLWRLLQEVTVNKTTDEWLAILEKGGIPAMRAATLEEVLHDPHLNESGFFQIREHPSEGAYRAMAHPVTFRGAPAGIDRDAPQLNQDAAYVRDLALGDELESGRREMP
jgi:crotonobetainyl-CoA:carnitine CoA-transferase CaiB-like acyl-CoA transferase